MPCQDQNTKGACFAAHGESHVGSVATITSTLNPGPGCPPLAYECSVTATVGGSNETVCKNIQVTTSDGITFQSVDDFVFSGTVQGIITVHYDPSSDEPPEETCARYVKETVAKLADDVLKPRLAMSEDALVAMFRALLENATDDQKEALRKAFNKFLRDAFATKKKKSARAAARRASKKVQRKTGR